MVVMFTSIVKNVVNTVVKWWNRADKQLTTYQPPRTCNNFWTSCILSAFRTVSFTNFFVFVFIGAKDIFGYTSTLLWKARQSFCFLPILDVGLTQIGNS